MYYCQHCGKPYYSDEAVVCVNCNAPKGRGQNFCHCCGNQLNPGDSLCHTCGVSNAEVMDVKAKSKIAAGLLGIFLGAYGVHNFYLGYTSKAVVQLVLTLVGMVLCCVGVGVFIVLGVSIWGLIEGIMILTGSIDKDGNGYPLEQ